MEISLKLDRPLAFFDLETTGTNTSNDRIVQLAVLILYPEGPPAREPYQACSLVNPEMPIPVEATAVHGITDADVATAPAFRQIANRLHQRLEGCDLAGYNVRRFDLPLLRAEFQRQGMVLDHRGRRILDLMQVFHREEPRDLAAAVKLYVGREHEGAHSAEADVAVLPALLEGQLRRYDRLPRDLDGLHAYCDECEPFRTEVERWFGDDLTNPVFQFGKEAGKALGRARPDYVKWLLGSDADEEVKAFVRAQLRRAVPA